MVVASSQLDLFFPESQSLKDKRHLVKSLIDRIRGKFNVSIAEIDCNDLWQRSILGVVLVTNDVGYAHTVLSKVVDYVEQDGRVHLVDYSFEVL
ncbi:MAG: DUF503 domain-containing protein [Candidatus Latescibacteria bacterium]|nr:DUF503 domain-containing protein [Candidatus Latescibacterota bacterium]